MNEEEVWLKQARQGDKAAFGRLIEAYQRPVYNLAYRMLNNSGEAEEAAQEAFIRAYTRLDSYNPAHKFSTWMLSITSNYCIDLIRKRRALLLSIDEPCRRTRPYNRKNHKGLNRKWSQTNNKKWYRLFCRNYRKIIGRQWSCAIGMKCLMTKSQK
ncbi:MAG: sigma-70 family RNA polymerase sigma factor [Chloroflexi bacterium]|nr:sigma-70 family RNA polymerase sigma factor [Chloroflexota bacterium]